MERPASKVEGHTDLALAQQCKDGEIGMLGVDCGAGAVSCFPQDIHHGILDA